MSDSSISTERLKIAIQKSGRLSDGSFELLRKCGFEIGRPSGQLLLRAANFPIDIMLIRDDDIPRYVASGVCDLGIVGDNVLKERFFEQRNCAPLRELGFGRCELSLAAPNSVDFKGIEEVDGKRIATSYPEILGRYLEGRGLEAKLIVVKGSVEIAPALDLADYVCDLVSTGATLQSNNLRPVETILSSQAMLIRNEELPIADIKKNTYKRLLRRVDGVLKAQRSKYIMMHAPSDAVETVKRLIPGLEKPTVIALGDRENTVAVHAVVKEPIFWKTMEQLKEVGASSILVVPIEKIVD